MTIRTVVCVALMALVALPVRAQDRAAETKAWQSLAASLQPGTFVEIRMKDGSHFQGTFVQRLDAGVVVKPRTRVPVPAREIAMADVESMVPAKPGMSPGKKVLIGLGAGLSVMALVGRWYSQARIERTGFYPTTTGSAFSTNPNSSRSSMTSAITSTPMPKRPSISATSCATSRSPGSSRLTISIITSPHCTLTVLAGLLSANPSPEAATVIPLTVLILPAVVARPI